MEGSLGVPQLQTTEDCAGAGGNGGPSSPPPQSFSANRMWAPPSQPPSQSQSQQNAAGPTPLRSSAHSGIPAAPPPPGLSSGLSRAEHLQGGSLASSTASQRTQPAIDFAALRDAQNALSEETLADAGDARRRFHSRGAESNLGAFERKKEEGSRSRVEALECRCTQRSKSSCCGRECVGLQGKSKSRS